MLSGEEANQIAQGCQWYVGHLSELIPDFRAANFTLDPSRHDGFGFQRSMECNPSQFNSLLLKIEGAEKLYIPFITFSVPHSRYTNLHYNVYSIVAREMVLNCQDSETHFAHLQSLRDSNALQTSVFDAWDFLSRYGDQPWRPRSPTYPPPGSEYLPPARFGHHADQD